jgi:hypothetical protein
MQKRSSFHDFTVVMVFLQWASYGGVVSADSQHNLRRHAQA